MSSFPFNQENAKPPSDEDAPAAAAPPVKADDDSVVESKSADLTEGQRDEQKTDQPGDEQVQPSTDQQQRPQYRPNQPQQGNQPDEKPTPRRVRGGIKLSAPEGDVLQVADEHSRPIVRAWMEHVQRLFPGEMWHDGLQFARSGQVMRLEFVRGGVEALVQGRRPRPQTVRIVTPCFAESQWQELVGHLSGEALHLASLLAGRIPTGLDDALARMDQSLVPSSADSIEVRVNETVLYDEVGAAACAIAGQVLASEPLLIFRLRGLSVDRLLDRMREARELEARGVSTAHRSATPDDTSARVAEPLEVVIDDFWGSSAALHDLDHTPPPHHVHHALLRRLGPSPIDGKFPLVGLLASIYDSVAAFAGALRDGGDADGDASE